MPGYTATIDYEPAESTTGMFGGNSNWRGPLWMPLNYLVLRTLDDYYAHLGESVTAEYPTGSGQQRHAGEVAEDLRQRLRSSTAGVRRALPAFGWVDRLQNDPNWRDNLLFFEYFHGDNGAGLGAMHQTGWTGLIADLIACPTTAAPRAPVPARPIRRNGRRKLIAAGRQVCGNLRRGRRTSGWSPMGWAATRWARSPGCAPAATTGC